MNDQSLFDMERTQIENIILRAAENVPLDRHDWINSDELRAFITSWHDLIDYYRLHKDTVMSASVAGEFRNFTRLLRFLVCDMTINENIRKLANEKLESLETIFEKVVQMAESNEGNIS